MNDGMWGVTATLVAADGVKMAGGIAKRMHRDTIQAVVGQKLV
jgi:hypothetical protein